MASWSIEVAFSHASLLQDQKSLLTIHDIGQDAALCRFPAAPRYIIHLVGLYAEFIDLLLVLG